VDRYWKVDRISAFEAPAERTPERKMRDVELRFQGGCKSREIKTTVKLPTGMRMPDLITYRGHTFIHRTDESYSEASMWPIVEELDR
jgi:hypothetical protein